MSSVFLKYNQIFFGLLFAVIGLPCLVLSAIIGSKSYDFLQHGQRTEGIVIKVDEKWTSNSKSGSHVTYAPIFSFDTTDGKTYTIHSSSWSSPPAYREGDHVDVLYRATDPNAASINSFRELWLVSIITGFTGFAFSGVGVWSISAFIRKQQLDQWLKQHGQRIVTEIAGAELNRSIKINKRSPYQIVSVWKDPSNGQVYTFKGENMWEDPTPMIGSRKTIEVLIKPGEPKKYSMDTSLFEQSHL